MTAFDQEKLTSYMEKSEILSKYLSDKESRDSYFHYFAGNMNSLVSFEKSPKSLQGDFHAYIKNLYYL